VTLTPASLITSRRTDAPSSNPSTMYVRLFYIPGIHRAGGRCDMLSLSP